MDILDRFQLSDWIDTGDPQYYGYLAPNGEWYIKRLDNANRQNRFARGLGDFPAAWAGREGLVYGYLDDVL